MNAGDVTRLDRYASSLNSVALYRSQDRHAYSTSLELTMRAIVEGTQMDSRASPDFGREFSVRPLTRFTQGLNVIVAVLLVNPIAAIFWEGVLSVLACIGITRMTRHGASGPTQVLIVLLFVFLLVLLRILGHVINSRIGRFIFGPPEFGILGGPEARIFRFLARAQSNLSLKFSEKDEPWAHEYNELNIRIVEAEYRRGYQAAVASGDVDPIVYPWDDVWRDKILDHSANGRTVRQTFEEWIAWSAVMSRMTSTLLMVALLAGPYSLVMVWLATRAVDQDGAPLAFAQFGLLGSFVIALIIYMNHLYLLDEIKISSKLDGVPEELRDTVKEWTARAPNRLLRPRVEFGRSFVSAIRNFYCRILAIAAGWNVVSIVVLLALTCPVGLLTSNQSIESLLSYASDVGRYVLLIPVGMVLGSWFGFEILRNVRRFVTLFVAGIVLALLPPLMTWIFTGRLPDGEVALISSVITGLISAAATALAELLRTTR
jgi:hypothetical protein